MQNPTMVQGYSLTAVLIDYNFLCQVTHCRVDVPIRAFEVYLAYDGGSKCKDKNIQASKCERLKRWERCSLRCSLVFGLLQRDSINENVVVVPRW